MKQHKFAIIAFSILNTVMLLAQTEEEELPPFSDDTLDNPPTPIELPFFWIILVLVMLWFVYKYQLKYYKAAK